MNQINKSLKKGFTLVELLITVVIIGILAAVLLPKFGNNSDKARAVANLASLKNLDTAIDVYRIDAPSALDALVTADGVMSETDKTNLVGALQAAGKIVLTGIPADQAAKFTAYAVRSGGVVTSLNVMQYRENDGDPFIVNANKTLSKTFGTVATGPTDFEGMSTGGATPRKSLDWAY